MGKLPDFIIIGCQRCGTSSLYNYITNHSKVEPASRKEIHFFDNKYHKGIDWYKKQFPDNAITGEASPYYIIHPHVPRRILKTNPHVKIIILLRNPVDRAYSHYHHGFRRGAEKSSFQDAIKQEPQRIEGELEKMYDDESYYSYAYQHFTYLERGKYVKQLEKWFKYFNNDQILIIKSESLFEDTNNTMEIIFKFLDLPNEKMEYKIFNLGNATPMDTKFRKELSEFFVPYNEELYSNLGRNFEW